MICIWCNDFSFSVCVCIYIYNLGNLTCWISLVCNLNQTFFSWLVFCQFICGFWTTAIGTPDRILCLRNCVCFFAQGGKKKSCGDTYSNASSSGSSFQLLELKWKETQFPKCILFGILGDAQSPENKYHKCTVPLLQLYRIDISCQFLKVTVESY